MQKTTDRNQLEVFGEQGHYGGWITSALQGKEIECFMQDGTWLILRTTDGHEARIGWADGDTQLKGAPFLENLDVRIQLPSADLSGVGGQTG